MAPPTVLCSIFAGRPTSSYLPHLFAPAGLELSSELTSPTAPTHPHTFVQSYGVSVFIAGGGVNISCLQVNGANVLGHTDTN